MIAREGGRTFLVFEIAQDAEEVLGLPRIEKIEEVVECCLRLHVGASYQAEVTGALRWPVSLRPEVLIDGTGRLL